MGVLFFSDERCLEHRPGAGHPERPDRLHAVARGAGAAGLGSDLHRVVPTPASVDALLRVHEPSLIDALGRLDERGGGRIDPDTAMSAGSLRAALLAVGSGLDAIAELDAAGVGGRFEAAFCAVRPPGHHATPTHAMGFCLLNSIAVAAATLAERGERVLVVDYDAHHGNGTQDAFYEDPRVLYVSFHQWPLYPGTGAIDDIGRGAGTGATVNVPFPGGTTGDRYRAAWSDIVGPLVEAFAPTWCLVSAGFDAHRADPLTDLGLSAGDVAALTAEVTAMVPAGRRIVFLEGGYDLEAIERSVTAVLLSLAGEVTAPEPCTSGGPGEEVVRRLGALRRTT